MNHTIQALSEHVIAQITATKEIRDLRTVVLGLLENSLDAGASKVNVTIDPSRRCCKVEDNGSGIDPDAFQEGGGLCRKYHTAKTSLVLTNDAHSCEGSFLASLAAVSYLCITSSADESSQNFLSLHHGRVLARGRPPVVHELVTYRRGTRVFVDDLLGNMPVRVKHFEALLQTSKGIDRLLEDIKHSIVATLLAWPRPCIVKVHNANDKDSSFILAAAHPAISHAVTSRALRSLDKPLPLSILDKVQILFQAGLVTSTTRAHWKSVSATSSQFTIRGLICLLPAPSARCQFISVGVVALSKESQFAVFDTVARLFHESSFAEVQTDELKRSAQKGVDRHPMFVFEIIDRAPDQPFSLSQLRMNKAQDILYEIVIRWLQSHDFQLRAVKSRKSRSMMQTEPTAVTASMPSRSSGVIGLTPRERTSSETSTTAGSLESSWIQPWTRIKSAYPLTPHGTGSVTRSHTAPVECLIRPDQDRAHSSVTMSVHSARDSNPEADSYMEWQDYMTKQEILVNLRTGMTECISTRLLSTRAQSVDVHSSTSRVASLPQHLMDWRPPVFQEPREEAIPKGHDLDAMEIKHVAGYTTWKASKTDLRQAQVIAQVDRKFILCRLANSELILLDQHAASERVLLEGLFVKLFSSSARSDALVASAILDSPIIFETTKQEYLLFQSFQGHFAAWAIGYDTSQEQQQGTASQVDAREICNRVSVHTLPLVIAERCRSSPRLLIDLMRQEVWRVTEGPKGHRPQRRSGGNNGQPQAAPSWLKNIDRCPKGILDMLNSRACRSAIMFNDPLTLGNCQELVAQLASTCFPFMCAHGRTSVVPLVDVQWEETAAISINNDWALAGPAAEAGDSFVSAYSRWTTSSAVLV